MIKDASAGDVDSPDFASRAREALLRYRRSDGRRVAESDVLRLTESLRLVGGISPVPEKVCDVATFGGLEPALVELFGIRQAVTTGSLDSPDGGELVFQYEDGREAHRFPHHRFDLENRFPLPDAAYDLVIFTEVLEHLSRDPMHTIGELNRITRPGGWLLLTTPNCVSLRTLISVVRGDHPYIWAAYSRIGDRDRHNREYTPGEVAILLEAAGYSVQSIKTLTVYSHRPSLLRRAGSTVLDAALAGTRRLLRAGRAGWNGELVFALARKAGAVRERHPTFLYY